MLNNKNRKAAISELEERISQHNSQLENLVASSEELYQKRILLKECIVRSELYINGIANTPKTFDKDVREIQFSLKQYQDVLDKMSKEIEKTDIASKGGAAAGVAAGVGVAAFGPTALMGIATTFGTASTGAAISSLSGAAATKAALAWLGGGALTAGGAGMAKGSALLALAGPIGWAIGGTALTAGGLLMNNKNKKAIAEARQKIVEVETQIKVNAGLYYEIEELKKITDDTTLNLKLRTEVAESSYPSDYLDMTEKQQYLLGALVNITLAGAESLNRTVGEKS